MEFASLPENCNCSLNCNTHPTSGGIASCNVTVQDLVLIITVTIVRLVRETNKENVFVVKNAKL
jgi:hypothetical protein